MILRTARPSDYDELARVVDDWWGRPVQRGLPRLFFDHFWRTSLLAETEQGAVRGFLVGLLSPGDLNVAYVHFAAVAPQERRSGLATLLYERFFDLVRAEGRNKVRAITSPQNEQSIAFHRRIGFAVSPSAPDYDGPGEPRVQMEHTPCRWPSESAAPEGPELRQPAPGGSETGLPSTTCQAQSLVSGHGGGTLMTGFYSSSSRQRLRCYVAYAACPGGPRGWG